MPTDMATPRWACDVCGHVYEGQDALDHAKTCEARPAPAPLPAGTFVLTHPEWLLMDQAFNTITDAAVQLPRYTRDPTEHDVRYRVERRGVEGGSSYEAWASDLWPHRPGVINHPRGETLSNLGGWMAAEAVAGKDEPATAAADAEATRQLLDKLAPDADPAFLTRFLPERRYGEGVYRFANLDRPGNLEPYSVPSGWLPPDLTAEQRAAVLALCQEKTKESARVYAGMPLFRVAITRPGQDDDWHLRWSGRRDWTRTPRSPHYSLRDRAYWEWAEAVALQRHAGDTAAAAWWLMTADGQDIADALTGQAADWQAGRPALVPLSVLSPSHGMTRGPRKGFLRPEHRDAADQLGAAGNYDQPPRNLLATSGVTLTAALTTLGVTVTDPDVQPFNGAPVIAAGSGKGGVGKSTVAAALAHAYADAGYTTLLLDADVTGPTLTALYRLEPGIPVDEHRRFLPAEVAPRLYVASAGIAFDAAAEVHWGENATRLWLRFVATRNTVQPDIVIVDMPPGNGPVHAAVDAELDPAAWLLITTGSPLAHADVRRTHSRARRRVAGVVENLSRTPYDVHVPGGTDGRLFGHAAATSDLADELGVPYLGSLPWEPDPAKLASSGELGRVRDHLTDFVTPATAVTTTTAHFRVEEDL